MSIKLPQKDIIVDKIVLEMSECHVIIEIPWEHGPLAQGADSLGLILSGQKLEALSSLINGYLRGKIFWSPC